MCHSGRKQTERGAYRKDKRPVIITSWDQAESSCYRPFGNPSFPYPRLYTVVKPRTSTRPDRGPHSSHLTFPFFSSSQAV